MSKTEETAAPPAGLPRATIKKSRSTWWLWLIPVGAVALCAWFIFRDYVATGPLLTIYFENADGLEEKNTEVRYRGAKIGEVTTIDLTTNNSLVQVKARLAKSAAQLARGGSIFWIVRPEVKLGGVTGLRTIISGEYVTVRPGNGPRTNTFFAATKEPESDEPQALRLKLLSPDLGSLREQSPVFYRGVQVGEVLAVHLDADARDVVIEARIHREFTALIRKNSVFWNAGGINFSFGLFHGAQISAESPSTLLTGGIAFATPPEPAEPASDGAAFRLYPKPQDEWKTWMPTMDLPPATQPSNRPAAVDLK